MWATSIGSTFAQIPVSGVRKSGIPEGTETPAPVSATVQLGLADQLGEPRGAGRRRYLPLHFGVRLPRKAPMPSLASSLPKAVAKPCFSASIPSSRSPLVRRRA